MENLVSWLVLEVALFTTGACGQMIANIQLKQRPAEVFENESVQLTLMFTGNASFRTIWRPLNVSGFIGFVDYTSSPVNCTSRGNLTDKQKYDVTCNETSITVNVKTVSKSQHLHQWTSSVFLLGDGTVYISVLYVKVAVTDVQILSTSDTNPITANEGETIYVRCISSYSRPNATISLHVSGDSNEELSNLSQSTYYYVDSKDLVQTQANFTFTAGKEFSSHLIYCLATNDPEITVTSLSYALNILYPPSIPPAIGGYTQTSTYRIREFIIRRLNCSIKDSNPQSTAIWECEHASYSQNDINDTQKELIFNVSRDTNASCSCSCTYRQHMKVSTLVKFDVLYPPDKVLVNLFYEDSLYPNISSTIEVIESKELLFSCSGNGNPNPDRYEWSGANISDTEHLYLRPSRHPHTNTITCLVFNTMNETEENSVGTGNHSRTYRLKVLYPPDLVVQKKSRVIENEGFTATCIANGGLTTSQSVTWNTSYTSSSFKNSTLSITEVKRTMKGTYICLLNYTLLPTYGEGTSDSTWTDFVLEVLYPPEKFVTDLTLNGTTFHNIPSEFSILENSILTMVCSARGNPSPTKYNWTGLGNSDSETLQLLATSSITGNLTCTAANTLTPTDQPSRNAANKQTYTFSVLYPPKLREYKEENVTIGTNFVRDCIEEPGNTNSVTVCWTGGSKKFRECNQTLTILNATVGDSGLFNCTVHFIMQPTFGEEISVSVSTSLFINVCAESNVERVVGDGPRNSVTGAVVGGALAGVVVIIAIMGTLYIVKKRNLLSRKDKGAKLPAYENTGFAQGVVRNPYEERSNMYEGLTQTATQNINDHQYEKLWSFSNRQVGQQKLYENLQLKQLN